MAGLRIYFAFVLFVPGIVLPMQTAIFQDTNIKTGDATLSRTRRSPLGEIRIRSLSITTKIFARFSTSNIKSEIENLAIDSKDVMFETQIPKTAFISNFSIIIDGHEYVGKVKEKAVAEAEYEEAKNSGVSAGLVQMQQRDAQWFRVSVNVESFHSVVFKLSYQQLLQRRLGKYEQIVFADPGPNVGKFSVDVYITEPTGLDFVEALDPYTDANNNSPQDEQFGKSLRQSKTEAFIRYFKSDFAVSQDQSTSRHFIVRYEVEHPNLAGDVWRYNGYFVHFLAPTLETLPKRVVFVVDTSGSMHGEKIRQTKSALKTIILQLGNNDLFNIVTFSTSSHQWNPSLVSAGIRANKEKAKSFVGGLHARGGTNLYDAILQAITLLDRTSLGDEVYGTSTIIVLTDGNPNSGVSNFTSIRTGVKVRNENSYPIFTLGFGSDVNHNFLRQIALENHASTRRIYTGSDASGQLEGFFSEIANPLLVNLTVTYSGNVESVTQTEFPVYFKGTEICIFGRYDQDDELAVKVRGVGRNGVTTITARSVTLDDDYSFPVSGEINAQFNIFFERMWAYLAVTQLNKRRIATLDLVESNQLNDEILRLSLEYNFVTPLTAMIAKKPEGQKDEATELSDKKLQKQNDRQRVINTLMNINQPSKAATIGSGISFSNTLGQQLLPVYPSIPHYVNLAPVISSHRRQKSRGRGRGRISNIYLRRKGSSKFPNKNKKRQRILTATSRPTTTTRITTLPLTITPAPLPVPEDIETECGFQSDVIDTVSIKTPGFLYSANQTCKWVFTNSMQQRKLRLNITEMDLEGGDACGFDRVVIYYDYSPLLPSQHRYRSFQTFCGFGEEYRTGTAYENIIIIFQSDDKVQGKGFSAELTTLKR